MARYARILSSSGVYHIMLRGNERKEIFLDNDDRIRFLDTLQRMKENGNYEIYAYCLMSNHVHLLVREGTDSLPRSIKRINVSYVYYFNRKYERVGHLFHDRYRSEAIEDDSYLLAAARYIHNNPVKAKITNKAEDYEWSSYNQYLNPDKYYGNLVDTKFLLSLFSDNKDLAIVLFKEFSNQPAVDENFLDHEENDGLNRIKDLNPANLLKAINEILEANGHSVESLKHSKDKKLRNQLIREIKENTNVSVRELSSIIKISKDIIFRA